MRRALSALLIALSWCLASDLFAQSFELGIHAGVNVAGTPTLSKIASEARNGIVLGGSASFELSPPFRLSVEAQYVQRSIEFRNTSVTGAPTDLYQLNYFEIPVNIRMGFGSKFRVYGLAGTNIGTLLSATRQINHTDGGSEEFDEKNEISSTSISLELGGGMSYAIASKISVVADARYTFGLNEVEQNQQPESLLNQSSWKPRDFKITTGLLFHLF